MKEWGVINIIGLLDYDLCQSEVKSNIVPNLEIMKLATYYRIEENHFCRLLTLDDEELDSYDKIYFFSELGYKLVIPDSFKRANNVIYGGSAFTNKQYVPFENSIIDYTIPRIIIYKDYLKQKYQEGYKNLVITHALDDTYYRMYAGNNKLPIPPVKPKQRVHLFDRDFFYPDWEDILTDISSRKPSGIHRVHPIVCNTLTQFFNARKYNKLVRDTFYILDLNINLNDVNYMISNYKKYFLADIVRFSYIFLPLKNNLPTLESYCRNLIYTLNLLYVFWSQGIPIKIYAEPSPVGINNPIETLQLTISSWTIANIKLKKQMDNSLLKRFKVSKALIQQYEAVINKMPYAKGLFNQTYEELRKRGYWKI